MILENDRVRIEIKIDETYTIDSVDNQFYDIIMNPCNITYQDFYKVFAINIDLFYTEFKIALIGDYYSYDTDCALLEENILTVLQNNSIIQIDVTEGLMLHWKKFDCIGCSYGIYKVKKGYIIYGEIEIIMLDLDFNKKWSFWGRDIFVSMSEKKSFEVCENYIKLYDFEGNYYEIDLEGNCLISEFL